jgi:hypothetical protein
VIWLLLDEDLEKVGKGKFDYDSLEHLLLGPDVSVERED